MKRFFSIGSVLLLSTLSGFAQMPASLVPESPSNAPDYFCTWNIQGYVCSYVNSEEQRLAMTEKNMFGEGTYQNWVSFFPKIRKDLYFVMDDSWDIPLDEKYKNDNVGTVELNQERFPSFTGNPTERLKKLVTAVEAKGWKGLGGWTCAQEAVALGNVDPQAYWEERMKTAQEAGFKYWKVDWGKKSRNQEWRERLTRLGRIYAPDLIIEHAMEGKYVSFSDVYRTYDVENITAQPVTIRRVAELLKYKKQGDAKALINCEDEPYIAVGMGCAIGVMRHPFVGNLPNDTADFVFPSVGRDIKNRLDEAVRGVIWHRIAEPFGVGTTDYTIDTIDLNDYWVLGKNETYNTSRKVGERIKESAPARVSRGLPLPEVDRSSLSRPFVLSSAYPNGAVAIVTIGHSINRDYITERVGVKQAIPDIEKPIGIFGDYESLTLVLPQPIKASTYTIWGQDLAGDTPVNITKEITIKGSQVIIPGKVIRKVGLSAASKGDVSDPGLVLKFVKK